MAEEGRRLFVSVNSSHLQDLTHPFSMYPLVLHASLLSRVLSIYFLCAHQELLSLVPFKGPARF